jgi:hypothetical protein
MHVVYVKEIVPVQTPTGLEASTVPASAALPQTLTHLHEPLLVNQSSHDDCGHSLLQVAPDLLEC